MADVFRIRLRAGHHHCWEVDPKTGKFVERRRVDDEGNIVRKPKIDPFTKQFVRNQDGSAVMEDVIEKVQLDLNPGDEFWATRNLAKEDQYKFELVNGVSDNGLQQRPGETLDEMIDRLVAMRDGQKKESEAPQEEDDNLDGMSVAELREFAKRNGIDLGSANTKDKIAAVIRAAAQLV